MSDDEQRPLFVAASALELAIHQGDHDSALATLQASPPSEHAAHRRSLGKLHDLMRFTYWQDSGHARHWGGKAHAAQHKALLAATVACGDPQDFLDYFHPGDGLEAEELAAVCRQFKIDAEAWRARLQEKAGAALRERPYNILVVQSLVAARVIDRPESEDYAAGLIAMPRCLFGDNAIEAVFDRDSGLYRAILRLFEVEGTGEHNLASVDKYNHRPEYAWSHIFMQGIAKGEFTRLQLLDKTLGTLERDWPQFRAGWFSRFHEMLAPSVDEMRPFTARYLGLCQSRIPPTVTLTLGALKSLHAAGSVGGQDLLAALQPVFHASAKAQVEAALKLCEAAVKREPALAHTASAAALHGLVHEATDLQKKIIERLKAWDMDDAARGELAAYLEGVATVNRPALLALTGGLPAAKAEPVPTPVGRGPVDPLDPSRALATIDNPAELVERVAFVLENPAEVDELERVLEALVRLAPLPEPLVKQCAPVVKRARKLAQSEVASRIARLLVFVAAGERLQDLRDEPFRSRQVHPQADEFLALRVDDLINQAAQGWGLTPLSSATHARGFIDPAVLIERIAAYQARGATAATGEQVRSLLRLALPGAGAKLLSKKMHALADTPLVRALRHALGEEGVAISGKTPEEQALFAAAARIRHPNGDDLRVLKALGDLGPDGPAAARYQRSVRRQSSTYEGVTYVHHDLLLAAADVPNGTPLALMAVRRVGMDIAHDEAMLRYTATVLPSSLESFFAEGCLRIGNNLAWWGAQWQDRAYIELLLDPSVPVTAAQPMAVQLLALALAGKEPGQTALAVDALVQSFVEGRLDVPALGAELSALLASSVAMAKRYSKSLHAAVRADAGLASPVFDLLCEMLAADTENPPRDLAALMELLLELALTLQRGLPKPTLDVLARLELGGKGRVVQKSLLALRRDV